MNCETTRRAPQRTGTHRGTQRGFTLIEIMVVVVILGIMAAFIVPNLADKPYKAQRAKAFNDFSVIGAALDFYQLDNFDYPSTDQGLEALRSAPSPDMRNYPKGGYLKKDPKDPWGRPYIYTYPGEHGEYDVRTYGRDGQPGGTGADQDLGNWMDP